MDLEQIAEENKARFKGRERLSCLSASNAVVDLIKCSPELRDLEVKNLNTYELLLQKALGDDKARELTKLLLLADDKEDSSKFTNFLSINSPVSHQFVLVKEKTGADYYLIDVTLKQFNDNIDEPWYKALIDKGYTKITEEEFRHYLYLRAKSPIHSQTIKDMTLEYAMKCTDLRFPTEHFIAWGD